MTKTAKGYIYTTSAYRARGWYKIGGTEYDQAADRIDQQDTTACPEPLEKIYESQKADGLWDNQIRGWLSQYRGYVYTRNDKRREWMRLPDGAKQLTDEVVKADFISAVNAITQSKVGLKKYSPTPTQAKALDSVMRQLEALIDSGDLDSIKAVADLCARFGKTLWVLELFRRLNERYGYSTLLLPAFWLSAHSSFEKEIEEFSDFNHFVYINTAASGWELKLSEAQAAGQITVVSLSLCGEASDERLERFKPIRDLQDVYMFCDEADVGAHTERSAKILDYVTVA
jgi:hypothetical protein